MKNIFSSVAKAMANTDVYCSDIYEAKMIRDILG